MAPASLEGQTLGKYRVLEPLGRGGMAQVYRAYHPQLDRYVAIKILRPDLVNEEEFATRFRREAQAVARLRHPNIVQAYDFDEQNEIYYMVMELLEGDTLKARLSDYQARKEKMPLGEMVRILLDVLDGLAYAHSEGMVHRDIKPANIMLTKRGQAVITDFGIARIVGGTQHTAAGVLMGTLNYMAPEQGLQGQSDARSDIYSLGIVFFEMLTGATPYDADTPLAILMKHLHDPLPLPRQGDPSIPEPFERIVLKALAKGPGDRFQNAEEMATALREAAQQAGIELPTRISLPLSFTTTEAPSESVAVLTGAAREQVADAQFAGEETDPSLARRLAAEQAVQSEEGVAPAASGPNPVAPLVAAVTAALRPEPTPPKFLENLTPGRAGLYLAALIVGGNVLMVVLGILTGRWAVFGRGWPIELLLVGAGLSLIMYASGSPGLLIPVGILVGNGALFSYCSITRLWWQWAFLWLLEVIVVAASIATGVRWAQQGEAGQQRARALGLRAATAAILLASFVLLFSLIFG